MMMRTFLVTILVAGMTATACSRPTPTAPTTAGPGSGSWLRETTGTLSAASTHGGPPEPRFVEGNAIVASVVSGTSCPTLSFVAEGYTINTSETTRYSAGECADIIPGRPVTIQGTLETDNSVTASLIVLKGGHPTFVEGEAVIDSIDSSSACPTLSFVAEGHTVTTIETTTYFGGTCDDLAASVRVQVKGLLLSDGSVTATSIMFKVAN